MNCTLWTATIPNEGTRLEGLEGEDKEKLIENILQGINKLIDGYKNILYSNKSANWQKYLMDFEDYPCIVDK